MARCASGEALHLADIKPLVLALIRGYDIFRTHFPAKAFQSEK
jgi:hypothetical protein